MACTCLNLKSGTLLANINPNGRLGLGEITVTELLSDNALAMSKESLAETTGSGGNTAEMIKMFLDIDWKVLIV